MVTIHIARNQQSLGSFSEEEVREGIRSGRFSAQDLTWKEGMETWKPLGEMAPQWGLETPPPIIQDRAALLAVDLKVSGDGTEPAWEEREKLTDYDLVINLEDGMEACALAFSLKAPQLIGAYLDQGAKKIYSFDLVRYVVDLPFWSGTSQST